MVYYIAENVAVVKMVEFLETLVLADVNMEGFCRAMQPHIAIVI